MDHASGSDEAPSPKVKTHLAIDSELCGRPLKMGDGYCRVEFIPQRRMAADDHGLVHGGFPFAAADYAAMLAVNDPHVVLAGAEVRFLKPTRVGERLIAEARVVDPGRSEANRPSKPRVEVEMTRDGEAVFRGTFRCYVPDAHVLELG